jgi:HJR/Mrr/RecB family endonuclease
MALRAYMTVSFEYYRSVILRSFLAPELIAFYELHRKLGTDFNSNEFGIEFRQRLHQALDTVLAQESSLASSILSASKIMDNFVFSPVNVHEAQTMQDILIAFDHPDANVDSSIQLSKVLPSFAQLEYDFLNGVSSSLLAEAIIKEADRIKRIIYDIYKNNDQIHQLGSRQFEELIAELLFKQGFEVQLTKQTRDGGYDILAIYHMPSQAPQKWLVECKKFTENKVGIEVIRSFKEVIQAENANRGVIATTSYFTKDAYKKQQEVPYLLDFRDKDAVMKWIFEYISHSK